MKFVGQIFWAFCKFHTAIINAVACRKNLLRFAGLQGVSSVTAAFRANSRPICEFLRRMTARHAGKHAARTDSFALLLQRRSQRLLLTRS
jgi:hypothetical protein